MKYNIERGAHVRVGVPAKQDRFLARTLAEALAEIVEIREAHLPMCFVEGGMPSPAQVLVLVCDGPADQRKLVGAVEDKIAPLLPYGARLDIWPLPSDAPLTESVRATECRILTRTPSGIPRVERPFSRWKMLQRRLKR
jgi:hypothetical protein